MFVLFSPITWIIKQISRYDDLMAYNQELVPHFDSLQMTLRSKEYN